MKVVLVRHGRAVDPQHAPTDALRGLTVEGRDGVRALSRMLDEAGIRCTRIYTSPLVRAVQTAEILAGRDDFHGPVEIQTALAPDQGTTAEVLAPLEALDDREHVALVGHEPRIRVLASHLLAVGTFPAFRSGAACVLHRDGRGETLFEWMVDPQTGVRVESLEALE